MLMSLNVFEVFAKIGLDTSEYEKNLDKSKQQGMSFGTASKKGFSVATKAVAAVTTATTAMGAAFVKTTGDVAAYGDNIDKMSQKMGMSAQAYQEWDAVMQHSGTSMETLKASMKTLANAAETGNDAFQKLGITQEQIATMSQEELFSETITALQNIEDETQRTYLAGKTLGRGATELGALLNTSAEDTQVLKAQCLCHWSFKWRSNEPHACLQSFRYICCSGFGIRTHNGMHLSHSRHETSGASYGGTRNP